MALDPRFLAASGREVFTGNELLVKGCLEVDGGVHLITGDDPWCDSTQVPADSRFLYEHLRIPVVEPGGPQELKDWINLSFTLSRSAGLYIGYIVTTAHADGG